MSLIYILYKEASEQQENNNNHLVRNSLLGATGLAGVGVMGLGVRDRIEGKAKNIVGKFYKQFPSKHNYEGYLLNKRDLALEGNNQSELDEIEKELRRIGQTKSYELPNTEGFVKFLEERELLGNKNEKEVERLQTASKNKFLGGAALTLGSLGLYNMLKRNDNE